MSDPKVTIEYVGGLAAHVRAGLLSHIVSEGARHEEFWAMPWDGAICPLCTYDAPDVLDGVAWPCPSATI